MNTARHNPVMESMIMALPSGLRNQIRATRTTLGWSQDDLARRAGLSRAGISAIETGRLVPSTAAALALAAALDTRVESLFQLEPSVSLGGEAARIWGAPPTAGACRYWRVDVGGQSLVYPVEASALGLLPHDGVFHDGKFHDHAATDPSRTLIVATCDPAVGFLADELARSAGVRLIALPRSSRASIELLFAGHVHAAGVHLARSEDSEGNDKAVLRHLRQKAIAASDFALLRVADWDEGIALSPGLGFSTIREVVRGNPRWVVREAGSAARDCLEEVLGRALTARKCQTPLPCARDHRGVAEAIHGRWADAGICLRLTGAELGLDYLHVRKESYDLCIAGSPDNDARIQALVEAVRARSYRGRLGELPGYNTARTGEIRSVGLS